VIPAAIVGAVLVYSTYMVQRQAVEQQTTLLAQAVMADLEREMAVMESALRILATSEELSSGDLKRFHQRARDALAPGIALNYVVVDNQGRQMLNTLVPYGATLPTSGSPPEFARVFTNRVTVVSDMFVGPVTQRPTVAMAVPVGAGDYVQYSLRVGVPLQRINELIHRREPPESWVVAVLDGSGTIVARSRSPEQYVGQKAIPEVLDAIKSNRSGLIDTYTKEGTPAVTSYLTSPTLKWSVVAGAPKAYLEREIYTRLAGIFTGIFIALGGGLWLARRISLRVLSVVDQLNDAAVSLGKGEEVSLPAMQLTEAEGVSDAMQQAGLAMRKARYFSHHDALTRLPNRLLFDEVAERNLALAQRTGEPMAVLAVDLDGFKGVNDKLGHATGDLVLQEVARRIQSSIRASDIAARIGGDEFLVALSSVERGSVMDMAERMVALLSQPYTGVDLPVSASIGVAIYPEHGQTLAVLAASADSALYEAKDLGKHRAVVARSL
jgi:diguanylate cyclase (GGDEF)-like protein